MLMTIIINFDVYILVKYYREGRKMKFHQPNTQPTPPPLTLVHNFGISEYPAMMSTATAKPMARGTRLLFSSSTAVRSTVNTSRNVRMPSARIAQPGYTPGPRVWAPPWISLYTDSGKTALKNLITFSEQQIHTACIVMSQVR